MARNPLRGLKKRIQSLLEIPSSVEALKRASSEANFAYRFYKHLGEVRSAEAKGSSLSIERRPDVPIVVSLTSYGERIHDVYITIETLFCQSLKPDHIILWLAEDEFSQADLPAQLTALLGRGLEIAFCPDYRSYKKLVPTIQCYPDAIIITVDDDVIYPLDLVEILVDSYKKDPDSVHCLAGRLMVNDDRIYVGKHYKGAYCGYNLRPLGVAGVLYPPRCLSHECRNSELFMELAPTNDDVWFKAMTLLQGRKSRLVDDYDWTQTHQLSPGSQESTLTQINRRETLIQTKRVFDHFALWERLTDPIGSDHSARQDILSV